MIQVKHQNPFAISDSVVHEIENLKANGTLSFNRKKKISMSHIVEIRTEVRDEAAVQLACRRRNLPARGA